MQFMVNTKKPGSLYREGAICKALDQCLTMRGSLPAYATIEAALILPVALLLTLFVIYLGFYQYDRCIAQEDAMTSVLRASNRFASTEEIRTQMEQELSAETGELIGRVTWTMTPTADFFSVAVEAKASLQTMKAPLWGGDGAWEFGAQSSAQRYHPTLILRKSRMVEELVK